MEAARTAETIRRHNPEDVYLKLHRCENLKSCKYKCAEISENITEFVYIQARAHD